MKLLTLNKIQTRKQFVDRLLQQGIIQDGETLQNMSSEDLALLVQNAWSPEARAAAAKARGRKKSKAPIPGSQAHRAAARLEMAKASREQASRRKKIDPNKDALSQSIGRWRQQHGSLRTKKITGNTLHDQNGEHGCADCGSTIPWDKTFCPECSFRFATNLLRNIWSPEARAKAIAARHKRAGLHPSERKQAASILRKKRGVLKSQLASKHWGTRAGARASMQTSRTQLKQNLPLFRKK